ncbi:DUF998 domain-containing protein [Nocardia amamiensis]|uniref:DUF998 domain-containing protein n=1 Tax=Nocardia amamiensis TaxID=404578 RepID=A0ABS0CQI4_9NOCA|nr:DUF998 domain-containing protein [Nocardia amamiensis]MBF6298885.1 DUF998 domain-containing protein [Nocardia amamiensis]
MTIEQKTPSAVRTGTLLACGAVAGPLYIAVTAIEAMTRAGFDPRQHRYNVLSTGDLGWIHRLNYGVAGVLMILFAVGISRVLHDGRVARWVPRLFGLYGVAYICSGLFAADPVTGFPQGTVSESTTWHGMLLMASRAASSAFLIGAIVLIAGWFMARGLRTWAWFTWAVPASMAGYEVAGAVVDTSTKYLLFLIPGISMWAWITALALHLNSTTNH